MTSRLDLAMRGERGRDVGRVRDEDREDQESERLSVRPRPGTAEIAGL